MRTSSFVALLAALSLASSSWQVVAGSATMVKLSPESKRNPMRRLSGMIYSESKRNPMRELSGMTEAEIDASNPDKYSDDEDGATDQPKDDSKDDETTDAPEDSKDETTDPPEGSVDATTDPPEGSVEETPEPTLEDPTEPPESDEGTPEPTEEPDEGGPTEEPDDGTPELTEEPVEGGDMGGAPVEIPPGTSRVLVETSMSFGFFDDNPVTEPTVEEIDGLLTRTSEWYADRLQKMVFPSLDSFQATLVASMFDPSAEQPVAIDFDANAFFPEGEATPTSQEVLAAMEMLDYQDYIMSAVWTTDMTGGVFDDVNEAVFEARATDPEEGTPEPTDSEMEGATSPPEKEVDSDTIALFRMAVEALGGEEALMGMSDIYMETSGVSFAIFESTTPENVTFASFIDSRAIYNDIANNNLRVDEVMQPKFEIFQFFPAQNFSRIVNGKVGALEGQAVFAQPGTIRSASVAALKYQQYLFNPHLILKNVLENGGNQLLGSDEENSFDVLYKDPPYTITLDPETGLVTQLATMENNPLVRDIDIVVTYTNWTIDAGGVLFPEVVEETAGGLPLWLEERLLVQINRDDLPDDIYELPSDTDMDVDEDSFDFGIHSHHVEEMFFQMGFANYGGYNPVIAEIQELVPGVLYLIPIEDDEVSNSLLVAYNEGENAIMVEAPGSHLHGNSLVQTFQELLPSATLTHTIQSHHHIDHSGASREVMALTSAQLIVGMGIGMFYLEDVFGAESTVVPDSWSMMNLTSEDALSNGILEVSDINFIVDEQDLSVLVIHFPVEHSEDWVITSISAGDQTYVYVADLYNAGLGITITLGGEPQFFQALRDWFIIDENCQSLVGELFFVPAHGMILSLEEAMEELMLQEVDVGCFSL